MKNPNRFGSLSLVLLLATCFLDIKESVSARHIDTPHDGLTETTEDGQNTQNTNDGVVSDFENDEQKKSTISSVDEDTKIGQNGKKMSTSALISSKTDDLDSETKLAINDDKTEIKTTKSAKKGNPSSDDDEDRDAKFGATTSDDEEIVQKTKNTRKEDDPSPDHDTDKNDGAKRGDDQEGQKMTILALTKVDKNQDEEKDDGKVSKMASDDDKNGQVGRKPASLNLAKSAKNDDSDLDSNQSEKRKDGPLARDEANFRMKMLPPLLTHKEIEALSIHHGLMLNPWTFGRMKRMFAKFAPDSWTEALDDVPLTTLRCVVREGTKIRLLKEQHFLRSQRANDQTEKVEDKAENEDADDGVVSDGSDHTPSSTDDKENEGKEMEEENEAIGIQTMDQFLKVLKGKCPRGFAQIVALNKAIGETYRQMPEHVRTILEEYANRFKNVSHQRYHGSWEGGETGVVSPLKATMAEFLKELKTVKASERENLAELFPKLRDVITDSRIDQLLDLGIDCMDGNKTGCNSASKLGRQIWTDGAVMAENDKAKDQPPSLMKTLTMRGKRQSQDDDATADDAPDNGDDGNGGGGGGGSALVYSDTPIMLTQQDDGDQGKKDDQNDKDDSLSKDVPPAGGAS